jgi:regulator of replication initiation timing
MQTAASVYIQPAGTQNPVEDHWLVDHWQERHHIVTQLPIRTGKDGPAAAEPGRGLRSEGAGITMTQADALQQAVARFGASIETLERSLVQLLEDRAASAKLKEQLQALLDERNRLQSERDRLARELDAERARIQRLEVANDEVSGRLEAVMDTLKDMIPAKTAGV